MFKKFFWDWIPPKIKDNLIIKFIGFTKIPLLRYVGLKGELYNEEKTILTMPLNRKTRNHVNSIYFACMTAGADIAAGYTVIKERIRTKVEIVPIFKDMSAEFYKRAEAKTYFTCYQNREIKALINKAVETKERHNLQVEVYATVPSKFGTEPIAKFVLNLSLKVKS